MAKVHDKVYLGYEDEVISDKKQCLSNYSVNKIGGHPDLPPLDKLQFSTKCPLCDLHRLLVVQCYAPLENSPYHRVLYVFACINPNCWIQSESWTCIRSQFEEVVKQAACSTVAMPTETSWCDGADEWDDQEDAAKEWGNQDNGDSANGNVFNVNVNLNCGVQRLSDDEESNSYEMESVEQALGNLHVFDAHNANMSPVQGAVGAIPPPMAAAELEDGEEPGLVTVDTPTTMPAEIHSLLTQTDELPVELRSHLMVGPLQFVPKFIYVEEEMRHSAPTSANDRVTELINKYRAENELELSPSGAGGEPGGEEETYEPATPLHGDTLLHAFLEQLKQSPGQILRYSRRAPPLLGAPLPTPSPSPYCTRCGSALSCELQLLPSLSHSLQLSHKVSRSLSHLHFLSVLVFTCTDSCWSPDDVIVNETVIFQPEV